MFWVEQGAGARGCLALHGWAGTHRDFVAVAAKRPPGWRFCAVDLPGCGASPPPRAWTLEAIAGELAHEVRARGLAGLTVAGYCSGALVALALAQAAPDCVARLVLIDPFAFLPWYFRIFTLGAAGRAAYRATFADARGRRWVNRILQRRQGREADFAAAFAGVDHAVELAYLRLFARLGSLRPFQALTLPVNLVYGEYTFRAVRASVRMGRRYWPQARVRVLPGVGHLPLVKAAGRLVEIIMPAASGAAPGA